MESVWKNTEKRPHFPELEGEVKTDVLHLFTFLNICIG